MGKYMGASMTDTDDRFGNEDEENEEEFDSDVDMMDSKKTERENQTTQDYIQHISKSLVRSPDDSSLEERDPDRDLEIDGVIDHGFHPNSTERLEWIDDNVHLTLEITLTGGQPALYTLDVTEYDTTITGGFITHRSFNDYESLTDEQIDEMVNLFKEVTKDEVNI